MAGEVRVLQPKLFEPKAEQQMADTFRPPHAWNRSNSGTYVGFFHYLHLKKIVTWCDEKRRCRMMQVIFKLAHMATYYVYSWQELVRNRQRFDFIFMSSFVIDNLI